MASCHGGSFYLHRSLLSSSVISSYLSSWFLLFFYVKQDEGAEVPREPTFNECKSAKVITFCAVLFRHPDSSRLPGSSCLNEETTAQWTESLFHNQLTTIAYFWCQWLALSILGVWLTPAKAEEKRKQPSLHVRRFPAEVPQKSKVRLCGRGCPPPLVPVMTLPLYYSSCLILKLPVSLRKVTVKIFSESQK